VPARIGLASAARRLEGAGFDSLWASDHLAMPVTTRTPYPFGDGGGFPWPLDLGWSDAIVSLGIAAAVTQKIELGTAVLVAPLRDPLLTAIQLATASVEASGRCVLGVGAGWLAEEFDAVGVPFSERGKRLDAWIEVVRAVWGGTLPIREEGGFYPNATEMICRPVPVAPVPILIGGMSAAALRRAGRLGDGWVALQPADHLDADVLRDAVKRIRDHAEDAGRDASVLRVVLQITGSAGRAAMIADRIPELRAAGADEIVVDIDWDGEHGPETTIAAFTAASHDLGGR
jgi:probable F420-dependent oxidoreductase